MDLRVINHQYRCKYFKIEELVHPDLLKEIPEDILWSMFDTRLLMVADYLREEYGPIFVNSRGLVNCGLRPMNSKVGAKYSAHKYGRALDLHICSIEDKNSTKEEKVKFYNKVRENFLIEEDVMFEKDDIVNRCVNFEDNISWLHIDTYNRANKFFKG